MAGDWIKMRIDLADDPAVIAIAAALDLDEDTIVGKLHRLWSWADRQTQDGTAGGVTRRWVDRLMNCDGFADAMAAAGWLSIGERGLTFPHFERHNGASAKRRAAHARRVASNRQSTGGKCAQQTHRSAPGKRTEAPPREEKRERKEEKTVDHMYDLQEKAADSENESGEPPPASGPIVDPSWRRTVARASRLAKKGKLPKATPEQRDFWLKTARLVEVGTIPEGLPADAVAGLLACDGIENRWAWLYSTLRNNARENHGIDLEAELARITVPPSILTPSRPADLAEQPGEMAG